MFDWKAQLSLGRARRAGRSCDWQGAATAYQAYLRQRPNQAAVWVQLGHSLKELGDLAGAKVSYARAIELDARHADGWLHLGHILKLQHEPVAAANAYASAASLAPGRTEASDELAALGGQGGLHVGGDQSGRVDPGGSDCGVADMESRMDDRLDEARRPEFFGLDQYGAYRRRLVVPRPPRIPGEERSIMVLIDARRAIPAQVRTTLSSLLDQNVDQWSALIIAPPKIRDHSVATLQQLDSRIRFEDPEAPVGLESSAIGCLLLDAGVELDRSAVAWFGYAASRTNCVAAYCDHDHCIDDWRYGRTFAGPVLHPMFDPDWFAAPDSAPAVLFLGALHVPTLSRAADIEERRRRLISASKSGGIAHIPLLLATVKRLVRQAELAPADLPAAAPLDVQFAPVSVSGAPTQRIQVIVQTRDQPELLRACIESLLKHVAHPDCVEVCIVDNRSVRADTHRLLDSMRRRGIGVLGIDEPFNWSRANNRAAVESKAPLLLFLNDDTEMLTPGWDALLNEALAQGDVGAVGAKLLYPDHTIQHAGMIFGMGGDGPVHEGVGYDSGAEGPAGRWRRTRTASAVTGAFMAMRRATFEAVGGFDAKSFSVAFNDVDICLKCRSLGLRVVQSSRIELVHHESKTRGADFTRSRVAWDLDDLVQLHRRWGAALFTDPGYNPHWSRSGRPFSGFRFPAMRDVMRRLDQSARPEPWRVSENDGADEPTWW